MTLTPKQLSFLRSKAHPLQPRLQLGKKGDSEGFRRELTELLAKDELVKVRLGRRVEVDLGVVASELQAELVQQVGRNAVFYRAASQPVIVLPGA